MIETIVNKALGMDDPNWKTNYIPHADIQPPSSYKSCRLVYVEPFSVDFETGKFQQEKRFKNWDVGTIGIAKQKTLYGYITLTGFTMEEVINKKVFDTYQEKLEDIMVYEGPEEYYDKIKELDMLEKIAVISIGYAHSLASGAVPEIFNRMIKEIKKLKIDGVMME